MKTTDPRDPLDRQIDDLLASRPIKPSADFAARVLAAANELPTQQAQPSHPIGQLLKFALPIAALFVIAFTLAQFITPQPEVQVEAQLSTADMQEILLLEEGLSGLSSQLEDNSLSNLNLLSTLDALIFEIES